MRSHRRNLTMKLQNSCFWCSRACVLKRMFIEAWTGSSMFQMFSGRERRCQGYHSCTDSCFWRTRSLPALQAAIGSLAASTEDGRASSVWSPVITFWMYVVIIAFIKYPRVSHIFLLDLKWHAIFATQQNCSFLLAKVTSSYAIYHHVEKAMFSFPYEGCYHRLQNSQNFSDVFFMLRGCYKWTLPFPRGNDVLTWLRNMVYVFPHGRNIREV